MGSVIIGCGRAVPELSVSNDDIAEFVDTSHEWIVERTGIERRSIAVEESCLDLACEAARKAFGWTEGGWTADVDGSRAGSQPLDPDSIDLVICCTMTPDMLVPSQAAMVKKELGLSNAIAFDLNSACAGFIYGLEVGNSMLSSSNIAAGATSKREDCHSASKAAKGNRAPGHRRALIIGVDKLSHIVDWSDRSTCILFGDGAGAIVLDWQDDKPGILSSFLKNTDDKGYLTASHLYDLGTLPFYSPDEDLEANEASNSAEDARSEQQDADEDLEDDGHFLSMNGREVFKFASNALVEAYEEALARADLGTEDLSVIIPHQANERIVRYAAKKGEIPLSMFHLTIANDGNTSAASIPMAMADAYSEGRIKSGDNVALLGFGGGLASGAVVFESV